MALISDDCENPVLKPEYPADADLAACELIDKFAQIVQAALAKPTVSMKDVVNVAKVQRQLYRKGYLLDIVYPFFTRWAFWLYLYIGNKPEKKPVQKVNFDVEEGQS